MSLRQIMVAVLLFLLAFTARADSAVQSALFKNDGEGFVPVSKNKALRELLETKPALDSFETAALGSAADLRKLLDRDPTLVKSLTKFGWTPLHMASFAGNVENVKLLLDRGANIEARAKNKFRNTPLQVALLTGEYEAAKVLLDRGADPLVRQSKGFSPMHEAAFLGRVDLIELLLDHGAEMNPRSDSNRTPLGEAIRGKHVEAADLLRAKGGVEAEQVVADEEEVKKK